MMNHDSYVLYVGRIAFPESVHRRIYMDIRAIIEVMRTTGEQVLIDEQALASNGYQIRNAEEDRKVQ